jgi:uncharacterized protein
MACDRRAEVKRRELLVGMLALATLRGAHAQTSSDVRLTPVQSRAFRAWMLRIVSAQLAAGPSRRWHHQDCAGLVRFAVAEALREHDAQWKRANGLTGLPLPPEVGLNERQLNLRHRWRLADGSASAYAGALELVQENTHLVSRDCNLALAGDVLFFDQGDAQHLMVWMGNFIAYHTGEATPSDSGLRAVSLGQLRRWPDTRWQPSEANPNFAGAFRFRFLSA